eukprot:978963-Rhodomonas_salina.1
MDPKLKRRGGAAFGCNAEDNEPDVHSKAAMAKARLEAKEAEKREKAAEQATKEQLAMEAELAEARRRTASKDAVRRTLLVGVAVWFSSHSHNSIHSPSRPPASPLSRSSQTISDISGRWVAKRRSEADR